MAELLPFVVEDMKLGDLPQVLEIESAVFTLPWPESAFRYELTHKKHSTMVVVRPSPNRIWGLAGLMQQVTGTGEGPVLGYAGMWLLVDEMHVSTIAVRPGWQGRGLGELLMLALLERGAKQGAGNATLEVRVSNHRAQAVYLKCGFEVVSRQKHYYVDNNEDAYIMATPAFDQPEFGQTLGQCRQQLHRRLLAG